MSRVFFIIAKLIKNEVVNYYEKIRIALDKRHFKKGFKSTIKKHSERIVLNEQQKKEINHLFLNHYGEKVSCNWHKYYMAFMHHFDSRFIPDYIFNPEIERFMNPFPQYVDVFQDKNVLALLAKGLGIKMPKAFCSRQAGLFFDGDYNIISKDDVENIISRVGEVFIKPTTGTNSGVGCCIINNSKIIEGGVFLF